MKSAIKQMQQILDEMKTIKREITPQELLKDNWIGGIEVQTLLHISEKTLYRHRRSGKLPYSRIRGKIYYKQSDIRNLLEKNYRIEKPKCTCCCK